MSSLADQISSAKSAFARAAAEVENLVALLKARPYQDLVENGREGGVHIGLLSDPFGTSFIGPEVALIAVRFIIHRRMIIRAGERRQLRKGLLGRNGLRVVRPERSLAELLRRLPGPFTKRAIEGRKRAVTHIESDLGDLA